MTSITDTTRFLQAIFPDHAQHAVFASADAPSGSWFHVRGVENLKDDRDCYLSPAAFPNDGSNERTLTRALEVRCLVIDDVGTEISAAAVERALGPPTAEVPTSEGSAHWWYALAEPMPVAEWGAFFTEVARLLGKRTHGPEAHHVFRMPMGTNTKPDRAGFKPHLGRFNPELRLNARAIMLFAEPEPANARGAEAVGNLGIEALRELMALIVNDESITREVWVNIIGHGLKALCADDDEGFEVFDEWSETWTGGVSKGSGYNRRVWDSLGASGGLTSRGGRLKAMARAAAPAKLASWEARAAFDDGEAPPKPLEPPPAKAARTAPQVLASGEFVAGFIPPDYLVKKLITKAFLYSLTGQTGAGKTSITLRLAATVANGASFGGLGTKPCRVLYLAAENPVDIQMRWLALGREMGFDVDTIQVFFVKGWFKIAATMRELRAEALRVGGEFGLVVVDTGPVFFEGEDANDRVAQLRHARMMRELIEVIPGGPSVIVNVHPVKNAGSDNLLPSGGGSFLNEVDGNLTAAKNEDQTIELSWQGKWRGVEFAPLYFLLKTATHPRLIDSDGEAMPTVVCEHLSTSAKELLEQEEVVDQGKILAEMVRKPRNSLAELASYMGWFYASGKPDKSKVQRYVKTLTKQKLVKRHLQLWVVTSMAKSKANGSGERIVSTVSIRPDTVDMKEY